MTQRIITIGTRLLAARRRQRLSVADAALGLGRLAGLGVSAALMRAWEQGQVPSRRYLPAIARRLHHCRDLGYAEPFDFLTWFEYAPSDAAAFDELVAALRASPEWTFVEREVDVRLVRA